MSDIIKLLPEYLANQIAAGEVVQRPASVIKELLENAIDAKATEIQLVIKDAGKQLIQVIDNGKGMSKTDARMSFERHATSKIAKTEDLFTIRTMGFRGEALASIAAVAQVEMKTRKTDADLGTVIKIEGSQITSQEPSSCPVGTNIMVRNLFFNVPARRNFLKSNPIEIKHIIEEYNRIALAHPSIAFSFTQNEQDMGKLSAGKLSQRIVQLFGSNYKESILTCDESTEFLSVRGYIGKPSIAKKSRGEQYFFVNNRFIKSFTLQHAVTTAYDKLLIAETFPFFVLFLEIDPKHIDINVHPTKTEIKFDDERTVYSILNSVVRHSLGKHVVAPTIDFDMQVNFNPNALHKEVDKDSIPSIEKDKISYSSQSSTPRETSNLKNWERLYTSTPRDIDDFGPLKSMPTKTDSTTTDPVQHQAIYTSVKSEAPKLSIGNTYEKPMCFQLHRSFILSQVKSGLMLIDQNAAHERILYEKYLSNIEQKTGISQQTLFPQQIEISMTDMALLMGMETEIEAIGFSISILGTKTIVVNGIPSDIKVGQEKELLEGLIEQFKNNQSDLKLNTKENLARAMAKRSAIKKGISLNTDEMQSLINNLFACSNPNFTPAGIAIISMLELDKIEKLFR